MNNAAVKKACGARAKKGNYGVQSMDIPQMRSFILEHGTKEAAGAVIRKSVMSRGELCALFHSFRRGREEIAKGVGMQGLRLTPSPVHRVSPVRTGGSPPKRRNKTPPKRRVPKPKSRTPSPEKVAFNKLSPGKMLNALLSNVAHSPKKAHNRHAHLIGRREHMYGPIVLGGRPPKRYSPTGNNNRLSQGSTGSNRSHGGNYGNESNRNNNFTKGMNFQNLRAKLNKAIKEVSPTRFNTRNMFPIRPLGRKAKLVVNPVVKQRMKTVLRQLMEKTRGRVAAAMAVPLAKRKKQTFMIVPHAPSIMDRIGTKAVISNMALRQAEKERWNKFAKIVKPNMTRAQKSSLANKLLHDTIRTVMGRNNSNSNNNSGSIPKARSKAVSGVKELLSKKLRAMERRKPPQVNIAKMFAKSIVSGRQVESAVRRLPTKEDRETLKKLKKQYEQMANNTQRVKNQGVVRRSPPKTKKLSSKAMGSLR